MIKKIQTQIPLRCVILFGSQARDNALPQSDYDILIVGDFQENYFDRCRKMIQFAPPKPIDLFCYTVSEFDKKFNSYNLTAIDAIDEGIVLFGKKFVEPYLQKLEVFKAHGLKRENYILKPPVF